MRNKFLNKLFAYEEAVFLWQKNPDWPFPVWPLIRFEVLTYMFYRKMKLSFLPEHTSENGLFQKIRTKINKWKLKTHSCDNKVRKKAKIWFLLRGSSCQLRQGFIKNENLANFFQINKKSFFVIKGNLKINLFCKVPKNIVTYDTFEKQETKHKKPCLHKESKKYISCCEKIFKEKISGKFKTFLTRRIAEILNKMDFFGSKIGLLYENSKVKKIVFEDAHQGDILPLVAAANKKNICTAEFQHGLINQNHLCYNMSKKTRQRMQRMKLLPKKFYLRELPFRAFKNYYECKIQPNMKTPKRSRGVSILFILNGLGNKKILKILNLILKINKKSKIVLKIHPLASKKELSSITKSYGTRCEIYQDTPIQKLILDAKVVIGEFSTGLITSHENGKRVFVVESKMSKTFIPANVGERLPTPKSKLIHLLQSIG